LDAIDNVMVCPTFDIPSVCLAPHSEVERVPVLTLPMALAVAVALAVMIPFPFP